MSKFNKKDFRAGKTAWRVLVKFDANTAKISTSLFEILLKGKLKKASRTMYVSSGVFRRQYLSDLLGHSPRVAAFKSRRAAEKFRHAVENNQLGHPFVKEAIESALDFRMEDIFPYHWLTKPYGGLDYTGA